ncbi:MAG: Fe-S cluster assembly protein SufD, partial [Arenimonas sp.]|nr:Fe-S cluster assembly protein SufD [Arenimonas sp.]
PLSQALAGAAARAVAVLARRYDGSEALFARLNAALAADGALLRVAAGVAVATPVHLVFVGAAAGGDLALHLRHLVELRKDASLTVLEHHLAQDGHRHLCNHVMHVHLASGARLVHARVQDEDAGATLLARTDAVLASGSEYRRVDLELGAGLSRHELNVDLQGEAAALVAGGVLLADGRRHLDTRLGIRHQARDTRCELPWRGLADGRGRAVFHGGIEIQAGADGSDASLSNKNLLLSDSAEIGTQPVLVIHADEVKAAHGATVGRLDDTALFYLRSRGIGREQARALLVQAFLREPLAALDDAVLAGMLGERLVARLAGTGASP